MRRGASLLEALLALLLFEFGVLALLGATAVSARDLATASRRARAQSLARTRVEGLRARPCAATGGVARWPGGLTEIWRVELTGRLSVITDSVVVPLAAGRRGDHVERGWSLCAP